MGHKPQKH